MVLCMARHSLFRRQLYPDLNANSFSGAGYGGIVEYIHTHSYIHLSDKKRSYFPNKRPGFSCVYTVDS